MVKKQLIDSIIRVEGGYVDNPRDSGGPTKFGITETVARANGYSGPMSLLPRNFAFSIYEAKYWDSLLADRIVEISDRIAEEVVDTGINLGVVRSAKFLQRTLNVFNQRGTKYPDLFVDGLIGNITLLSLEKCLGYRSEDVVLKALNCLQGAYYIELAERREKDEDFVYGWLKNRVNL